MIQQGSVQHGAIHFSRDFPVRETPCGRLGPAAALWRYVTCLACLEAWAGRDERIAERLERVKRWELSGSLSDMEPDLAGH